MPLRSSPDSQDPTHVATDQDNEGQQQGGTEVQPSFQIDRPSTSGQTEASQPRPAATSGRATNSTPSTNTTKAKRGRSNTKDSCDDALLEMARAKLLATPSAPVEDECDVFCRSVAYRMRSLSPMQKIFARKYISDVLFEAEMGQLSNETHLTQMSYTYQTMNQNTPARVCTPDLELLSLSLRPYYIPREIPKININVVYIPPDANREQATLQMTNIINDQQEKSPDSVILVTGDFNHHTLEKDLTNFHQYIDCPTRGINTLDLCYGNVKEACTCKQLAKLGESDHNMIQLIPKHRSVLKSVKPVHKTVNIYNEESIGALQACLDCTDWGVFVDSCEDLEELNDVVSHYIQFYEDLTIPKKTITCYPNSKPWTTRELTDAVARKNKAFRSGNKEELKEASKNIKIIVKECKKNYKEKVERNIKTNTRAAWEGMKAMSGCRSKKVGIDVEGDPNKYANDLNKFFARFDVHNFKKETKNV
ncbi:hypothetical protein ElyMa_005660600 [Elysia marginata]|uniref:BESS domain-containing protein n=1 Tax=Elysia marginata TaxID=1093978 RepID=A0AAV4FD17_9GAST|nr:hypothetical protein ElyMa_005660600 [Elysia marginata]